MSETETLTCQDCGSAWRRTVSRGRKPSLCMSCRGIGDTNPHGMTEVDGATRLGTCSVCGPQTEAVRHGHYPDGRRRWLCAPTHRARDRRYRELREGRSRVLSVQRRQDRARVVASLVGFMDSATIMDLARISGLRGDDLRRFAGEWAVITEEQRERAQRLRKPRNRKSAAA